MDTLKSYMGGDSSNEDKSRDTGNSEQKSSDDGGFMGKLNNMAGGGAQGEKNEDGLDKAIDFVQEKVLGQGDQSNETAAEQAKDEAISDYLRGQYKTTTGSDMPIEDKDKNYGS